MCYKQKHHRNGNNAPLGQTSGWRVCKLLDTAVTQRFIELAAVRVTELLKHDFAVNKRKGKRYVN